MTSAVAKHPSRGGVGGPGHTEAMVSASGHGERAARELLRRRIDAQWIAPRTDRDGTGAATATATATATSTGTGTSTATSTSTGASAIADVVAHLLAVQAQDFGQAVWALGLRAPGSTRSDVDAALDERAVVRSWPMRGTLHFSTPDDLRLMLSITAARTMSSVAARHRQLGIDEAVIGRAGEIATGALRGGGSFSRDEFFALLEADGIATSAQRGQHLIWCLAHQGLLCWGPASGSQQAMVLLDEWAPATRELGRDEALGEFVLHYVRGRGPVTLKDFCWWSKVTVAEAKAGLARVREQLDEVTIGGEPYLVAAGDSERAVSRASGGTFVLPGFDEFLLGYQSRSPAVAEQFAERIVPGNNGIFLPMLVSRGEIVGTWRRSVGPKKVTVTAAPFAHPTPTERAGFVRGFGRYADFLGLPLSIADADAEGAS